MSAMRFLAAAALTAVCASSLSFVHGQVVSVKLTTNALGLGTSDYNDGGSVDPDVPGAIVTSPVVGQGTILKVQRSGLAGPGTVADPLLVTVTSRTHLDTTSGLPANHDFVAGVIYLSNEASNLPDGAEEGLGVRAFTVNNTTGLRTFDGSGFARIEGSKDVSGGTGPAAYVIGGDNNGAPHVDEDAQFDFNPALNIAANTVEFLLSKYDTTDVIDIEATLASGVTTSLSFQGTSNTALFQAISASAKLWKVKIAGLPGVTSADLIRRVRIRAIDDNPSMPAGTAEHFLITGILGTIVPCPVRLQADVGPPGSTMYNFSTTSPQTFVPGEALRWTMTTVPGCTCTGGPILIIANVGAEATSNAVTPGLAGFNRFHNLSIPTGVGLVLADGFGATPFVGFPVGAPAPNFVGDAPWGFITPVGLPAGFHVTAQALVYCPLANALSVSNEITWISVTP